MSHRKLHLHCGMAAIQAYEQQLSAHLIAGLLKISRVKIWGITDKNRLNERVPTISFTVDGYQSRDIAKIFADENIFVWDGHYYAIETINQLGLTKTGGMIRVGPAHYNTIEELDQFLEVLTAFLPKH